MKINILFIAIVLIAAVFTGCQKSDSDVDYGYTYIYMPQSTLSSGSDNNFTVPLPSSILSITRNYQIDSVNHKLNICLGVTRSGKQPSDGYAVNVVVDKDTTNALITAGKISNGMLLPDASYAVPSVVTVPAGKTFGTFYLTVDVTTLKLDAYTGKNLAITVRIASPTNYSLNTKYSKTVVIIAVNAIRPYLK
ncbi:MAG: DUF1735 domain-containing protein [Bacteroidota bacterium]|nr:DUF1735 domain-containing protein [Bacteroidota bacterium]